MPKAQDLTGPFICHPDIKISDAEMLVLKKDPKYSLMQQTNREMFAIESELSLAKHRYS